MSYGEPPDHAPPRSQGAVLIREAVIRYRGPRRRIPAAIRYPTDVVEFIRNVVQRDAREHFLVLFLDGRHRPIAYQVASVGTATASLVHPREIFQAAVGLGACAILVAHNHPSGDPNPSPEDRSVTDRLVLAGQLLGIPLLDPVIVTQRKYASIRELEPQKFTTQSNESL